LGVGVTAMLGGRTLVLADGGNGVGSVLEIMDDVEGEGQANNNYQDGHNIFCIQILFFST
jgi:hypothetical protein